MTVSRARLGAELRLALAEADAPAALASMGELGVLAALPMGLSFDRELAERAIALLPPDGRPDLLLTASLLLHLTMLPAADPEPVIFEVLDELEFTAADRERAMRSALAAPTLVRTMTFATRALADARGARRTHARGGRTRRRAGCRSSRRSVEAASEWFQRVRRVRLEINGEDLIAAGVGTGPEIGRA